MPATDRALARAADDLRRGEVVRIVDGEISLLALAAELATPDALATLSSHDRADLLITPQRAATLHILNQAPAADAAGHTGAIAITRMPWLDLAASLAVADPVSDLSTPFKGPFPTRPLGTHARAGAAALALAKRATLLPAVFAVAGNNEPEADMLSADAAAILGWRRAPRLQIVSRARLPLEGAENTRVVAFRPLDGGLEHLALLIGEPQPPPLVRLHSACLTGDVLGSLKCDCGPQLRAAVERIAAEGGILLYLQQEGRGIGLLNKLRAYQLQDQGFDTVDANLRLGFQEDERDFDVAAAMLKALGVEKIRLLTNNPLKAETLAAEGIEVIERVGHILPPNPHNAHYLQTKRDRQRHIL